MIHPEEIDDLIPQRPPFRMLDRVLEVHPGVRALGVKLVSANELDALGHFQEITIMPGALVMEAIGQTAIVLYRKTYPAFNPRGRVFLFGRTTARFLRPVFAGHALLCEVRVVRMVTSGAVVRGRAFVEGKEVANCEMSFAVSEIAALLRQCESESSPAGNCSAVTANSPALSTTAVSHPSSSMRRCS